MISILIYSNTNSIVFTSNRTTDTVLTNKTPALQKLVRNYNLFMYNPGYNANVAVRLPYVEQGFYPHASISNFYYLSDQRGSSICLSIPGDRDLHADHPFHSSIKRIMTLILIIVRWPIVMTKNLKEDIFLSAVIRSTIFTPATRRREVYAKPGQKKMSSSDSWSWAIASERLLKIKVIIFYARIEIVICV